MAAAEEPREPGPRRLGRLARACPLRLQLPPRRPLRRGRARPGREARRDPRAPRRPRPATASCSSASTASSVLCPDDGDHRRSWFVYPVRLPGGDRPRAGDRRAWPQSGIGTARYLPSIHLQPYMRERFGYREGMLPVSEEASRRLLALPFFTEIAPDSAGASRRRACPRRSAGRRGRIGPPAARRRASQAAIIRVMADAPKMVFLGFGKYVRADHIYALEPITDERRGRGRRTLVWVEGIAGADRRLAHRAHDPRSTWGSGTPMASGARRPGGRSRRARGGRRRPRRPAAAPLDQGRGGRRSRRARPPGRAACSRRPPCRAEAERLFEE